MLRRALLLASACFVAALPLSGASAESYIDYEKSVGQVNGADTINLIVEATSDGGYVVGGQTIECHKAKTGVLMSVDESEYDVVPLEECAGKDLPHDEGVDSTSPPLLSPYCAIDSSYEGLGVLSEDNDDEYSYDYSCVDYIAKMTKDGAKEWLTTIRDGGRPIAVGEVDGGGYRMIAGDHVYRFGNNGVFINYLNIPNANNIIFAALNPDGSFVYGNGVNIYYNDNTLENGGALVTEDSGLEYYPNMHRSGAGYVIDYCFRGYITDPFKCETLDTSKDLKEIRSRTFEGVDNSADVHVISSNAHGDVMIEYFDSNEKAHYASFDKNGKKIGENDNLSGAFGDMDRVMPLKDYVMIEASDETIFSATKKMVQFNRDLTVRFEYYGEGGELIADAAQLKDNSLVGVGMAWKGSTKIPVTGDVNGGYLRLTDEKPAEKPAEEPADEPKEEDEEGEKEAKPEEPIAVVEQPEEKNPNTFDGIYFPIALFGAILLSSVAVAKRSFARR